jgi:hypothetical protein
MNTLREAAAPEAHQPKAEPQSGIKQVVELYDSPEHEPAAVKAAWLAGYTEGQKDAWAAPQPKAEPQEPYCYTYTGGDGEEYFAPPTGWWPEYAKPLCVCDDAAIEKIIRSKT